MATKGETVKIEKDTRADGRGPVKRLRKTAAKKLATTAVRQVRAKKTSTQGTKVERVPTPTLASPETFNFIGENQEIDYYHILGLGNVGHPFFKPNSRVFFKDYLIRGIQGPKIEIPLSMFPSDGEEEKPDTEKRLDAYAIFGEVPLDIVFLQLHPGHEARKTSEQRRHGDFKVLEVLNSVNGVKEQFVVGTKPEDINDFFKFLSGGYEGQDLEGNKHWVQLTYCDKFDLRKSDDPIAQIVKANGLEFNLELLAAYASTDSAFKKFPEILRGAPMESDFQRKVPLHVVGTIQTWSSIHPTITNKYIGGVLDANFSLFNVVRRSNSEPLEYFQVLRPSVLLEFNPDMKEITNYISRLVQFLEDLNQSPVYPVVSRPQRL